ncbi:MAG: CocE/NonD family hydrolase [Actinomycetota bacterium]
MSILKPPTRRRWLAMTSALVAVATSIVPGALFNSAGASGPAMTVTGSVDAVYVSAPSGTALTLKKGTITIATGLTDTNGTFVFHDVAPGKGYVVTGTNGSPTGTQASVTVLNQTTPAPSSFYKKVTLKVGLNYLPMRDGITIAATLRLPAGVTSLAKGPFPTLVEYSGYQTAAPGSLLDYELGHYTGDHALLPSTSTVVGSLIGPSLGYAVVSLQMRGSGCSGGAFDLFGPTSPTDGYDAITEIANQKWVANHKVGLVGISYSGISEFGPAGLNPPGLAAIAPLSPTEDLYSTGSPGGIANTGFAAGWIAERVHDAKPASATEGQAWAWAEINAGDTVCSANQQFHGQAQDVQAILSSSTDRVPALYDLRSPLAWASKIKVPVFLVAALQDEQTGPQWTSLIKALAKDKDVYATVQNGAHVDSLDPDVVNRWMAFNSIFVAKKVPTEPGLLGKLILGGFAGTIGGGAALQPVPYTGLKTPALALAAFRKGEARVTVNFDNGNGAAGAGRPQAAYTAKMTAFPPTNATATTLYLGPSGTLVPSAPSSSTTSYQPDPSARPATSAGSSFDAWAAHPNYNWQPVTGTNGLGFTTASLASNLTIVGKSSLNLMLASTATDTDLQVTISEVRPNGSEMYVTSGWLRAKYMQSLNAGASTAFEPAFSYNTTKALVPGVFTSPRVPLDGIAHTFRAGAELRVTISAPGGDRPSWAFSNSYAAGATNTIQLGSSAFVFPVLGGITPTDSQPACGSNRGQPCRTYVAAGNGG